VSPTFSEQLVAPSRLAHVIGAASGAAAGLALAFGGLAAAPAHGFWLLGTSTRSEEHTSELQSHA